MTTYVLPTDAPIGTMLYYNGDAVWFNGVAWQPIVTGSIKLNEAAAEIATEEAAEASDVAALQAEIDSLQSQINQLENDISSLDFRLSNLE